MIVKVIGDPAQVPFSLTVIVATRGEPEVFTAALKSAIVPDPLAASPIDVLLFVQVTVAPVLVVKAPTLIRSPEHTTMFGFWVIILSGLIVMVNSSAALTHPSFVAVTLMFPTISDPVLLAGDVKMISPFPVVAIPIDVLSFVHARVEPATFDVSGMLTAVPGQNV